MHEKGQNHYMCLRGVNGPRRTTDSAAKAKGWVAHRQIERRYEFKRKYAKLIVQVGTSLYTYRVNRLGRYYTGHLQS